MDPYEYWNAIALREPEELSAEQRPLYALGWLRAEVNNGGFDQLFNNSAGDVVPDAAAAARSAGATALAELITEAMSVFGSVYPVRREQRQEKLFALSDADQALLNELDNRYYELESSTNLDTVMEHFVRGTRTTDPG